LARWCDRQQRVGILLSLIQLNDEYRAARLDRFLTVRYAKNQVTKPFSPTGSSVSFIDRHEIYNQGFAKSFGTVNGNIHAVVVNSIPFAIPGDYIFEVTAFTFVDSTAMNFGLIRSAHAQQKKKTAKSLRKKRPLR
jgi:hypothetical protein